MDDSTGFQVSENDLDIAFLDAAEKGDVKSCQQCIQQGADLFARDESGCSGLHLSAYNGHKKVLELIVNLYKSRWKCNKSLPKQFVQAWDNHCYPPIYHTAAGGSLECFKLLHEHGGNSKNPFGYQVLDKVLWTKLLMIAARKGHTPILEHLLRLRKSKTDLSKSVNGCSGGCSALHYATAHGNLDCMKLLLDAGASVDDLDNWGCNCVHLAAGNDYPEIVQYLIERGGTSLVNAEDNRDNTPLFHALRQRFNQFDAAKKGSKAVDLLYNTYSASLFNSRNVSALEVASSNMRFFLESTIGKGININEVGSDGRTPITRACQWQDHITVQALLDHGADPSLLDGGYRLPLMEALRTYENLVVSDQDAYRKTLCYLIRAGCNVQPFVPSRLYLRDPVEVACINGTPDLLKMLYYAGSSFVNICKFVHRSDHLFKIYEQTDKPSEQEKQEVHQIIKKAENHPYLLRELCRNVVRKKIGKNPEKKISMLTMLPFMLKEYLNIPELDDIQEEYSQKIPKWQKESLDHIDYAMSLNMPDETTLKLGLCIRRPLQ